MNELFFGRLRLLVNFEIASYEGRLTQLSAVDYPTDTAPELIKELQQELTRQRQRIEVITVDHAFDPKGAGDRLRSEHRKLLSMLFFLVSLENAQTRRVPWSIVPSLESVSKILMPDQKLLTSTLDEFNYTIKWYKNSPSNTGLAKFNILEIPSIHRVNGFLHICIGHELFHPVLDDYFESVQPAVVGKLRDACEKALLSQRSGMPLIDASRLDRLVERARVVWRRAMEELMCDMGCTALFGPAGILGLLNFSLGFTFDEVPSSPDFYPPFRYRLRTVLKFVLDQDPGKRVLGELVSQLETERELDGFAKVLNETIRSIKDETLSDRDIKAIRNDAVLKIAYDQVDETVDGAWMYIQQLVKSFPNTWSNTYQEVPALLARLIVMVPPSEINLDDEIVGKPAAITAILVACWLYELERIKKDSNSADSVESYMTSCRLLLKALEDSELKRTFEEMKRKP